MPNVVPGEGPVPARIMLIGEAPGKWEDAKKRPFVGDSGEILNWWWDGVKLPHRKECYVTNVVKTRPPGNRTPNQKEISNWLPVLYSEFEKVRPEIVVAFGGTALRVFLPDMEVDTVHGLPHQVEFLGRKVVVIPAYHPAAGMHDTSKQAHFYRDMEAIQRYLAGELGVWQETDRYTVSRIVTDPCEVEAILKDAPSAVVAVDTEGDERDPWGLTFAVCPGEGVAIPAACTEALTTFHHLLLDGREVLLHYAGHDLKVLRAMGVRPQQYTDTMLMAYELQTLPQGLKPLAYRLAGMVMQEFDELPKEIRLTWDAAFVQYACMDPDATLRCFFRMAEMFTPDLSQVYELDAGIIPLVVQMETFGMPFDPDRLSDVYGELLARESDLRSELQKFALRRAGMENFNPGSPQQVAELLYGKLRLKIRKRTKGGKPSTDEKALSTLKHPVVDLLLDYREVVKMKSTYASSILEAASSEDSGHSMVGGSVGRGGLLHAGEESPEDVADYN